MIGRSAIPLAVSVGATGVGVGDTGVAVGGTSVGVGGTGVDIGGTVVGVGEAGISVGSEADGAAASDAVQPASASTPTAITPASVRLNGKLRRNITTTAQLPTCGHLPLGDHAVLTSSEYSVGQKEHHRLESGG